MLENIERNFRSPGAEDFSSYVRKDSKLPPIKTPRLSLGFLCGEPRRELFTPTTGDASLVLFYKNREGVVSSLDAPDEQISVVQLQGAYQEGYRINTSLHWINLFADQIVQIAKHPDNGVHRLIMPTLLAIQGFADAHEAAMKRYEQFAARANLRLSHEEQLYVRDF